VDLGKFFPLYLGHPTLAVLVGDLPKKVALMSLLLVISVSNTKSQRELLRKQITHWATPQLPIIEQ
jgi:hypothetical protein